MLEAVAARAAAADVTLVCGGAAGYTGGARLAADALASGALGRLVCLRSLQLGSDPHARWPLAEQLALANSLAADTVTSVYAQSAGKRHLSVSLSYAGGANRAAGARRGAGHAAGERADGAGQPRRLLRHDGRHGVGHAPGGRGSRRCLSGDRQRAGARALGRRMRPSGRGQRRAAGDGGAGPRGA